MILIIILLSFFIGICIGCYVAGYTAYDEGVRDEREHWYIHAHCWWHDIDEYNE